MSATSRRLIIVAFFVRFAPSLECTDFLYQVHAKLDLYPNWDQRVQVPLVFNASKLAEADDREGGT